MNGSPNMFWPTVVMGSAATILLFLGYLKGGGEHINGLRYAGTTLMTLLPLLISAFIVAGMMSELIPKESVSRVLGEESGLKGILFGAVAGGMTPGGPFVSMPIAAGLLGSGASVGPAVSYLTGWSLWAFYRLPIEVGFLGWKLTMIRFLTVLFFPILAGVMAQFIFGNMWNSVGK